MCLISISLQLICNLLQLLFSIFSASSSIFFIFSVLLLLLEHVKLDNNFCYQVLVEVCMFLIIFVFIILPMLVWITYFCRNFRKKIFYFSQFKLVIACHLSKICLQSERKAWFYLAQNPRSFISKRFDFLFRKKRCSFKIAVPKFSVFLNSLCLLLAIFRKYIFNQKGKRGFIWPRTFDLLFKKHLIFYSEKRGISLK